MGQAKQFDPAQRLDLAVDAFWRNGFDGSGMQALCKAMGLFPGSLYGTYGDKRQLFLQAVERYMVTVSADAIEVLGQGGSGLAAIRRFFDQLIDGIFGGKRRWGCLVTNTIVELAEREPAVAAMIDLHLARLETAFAGAIERARHAGELPPDTPLDQAQFLVCLVQGLNVLAKTRPSRDRLERVVSTALSALNNA
ncbi:MAG: transcriptional regulator, TetR family [Rhodospirillales bacterium]|nr:transcriptional regulator, TetR family [Rhodospirillales bacterium]